MWKCPKCGREFARIGQQHYCEKPRTIDEYIAAQSDAVQPKLRELRQILSAACIFFCPCPECFGRGFFQLIKNRGPSL